MIVTAMILSARTSGLDGLADRLTARLPGAGVEAALDEAAANVARAAASRLGRAPDIRATPGGRQVGSADPAAVARETGTLARPPDPWLLPALADLKSGLLLPDATSADATSTDGGTAGTGGAGTAAESAPR